MIRLNGLGQPASPVPPYEDAKTITRVRPMPGAPPVALVDPRVYERPFATTMLDQEHVNVRSLKPSGTFDDGMRVKVMPDGSIRPTGPVADAVKATIAFRPEEAEPYNRREDSTFRVQTAPVRRTFAIQEDIRPYAEFLSPETMVDGLGTTIPTIPIDEDFDAYDRHQLAKERAMAGFGTTKAEMPIAADFDEIDRNPKLVQNIQPAYTEVPMLSGHRVPVNMSFEQLDMLGAEEVKKEEPKAADFWTTATKLLEKADIEKIYAKYKGIKAKKPAAPAPAPAPIPVQAAPAIGGGIGTTTILIIAGVGVVTLGGIMFMMMRRK